VAAYRLSSQKRRYNELSAVDRLPPSDGGFVPDFAKGRSFVIMQIGGFVFQNNSQLSAVSHQLTAPVCRLMPG